MLGIPVRRDSSVLQEGESCLNTIKDCGQVNLIIERIANEHLVYASTFLVPSTIVKGSLLFSYALISNKTDS